jgi:hypothetical protein
MEIKRGHLIILSFILLIINISLFVINNLNDSPLTGGATGIVGITIIQSQVDCPEYFNIKLHSDKKSVILNWSEVPNADEYVIYYSYNLTAIRNITPESPNVNVVNTTNLNWTDYNADQDLARFYRVGTKGGSAYCVLPVIAGKQTYELVASADGDKQYNLIALIHNYNYTMENYLIYICDKYPQICNNEYGLPIIQTIDRSNPEQQPWAVHPYSYGVNANYEMDKPKGYLIHVNETINNTEVGILDNYTFANLIASDDGDKQYNLFGDRYPKNYTMEEYLEIICQGYPQICNDEYGLPIIQTIDRSNPEQQPWAVHPYSYGVNANYGTKPGVGYLIHINESITLIYNNTVIQ